MEQIRHGASRGRGGRIEVYLHGQPCARVRDADDRQIDHLALYLGGFRSSAAAGLRALYR